MKTTEIPENSNFFLNSYRKGLLTCGGSIVVVEFDINESEGKHVFRKYDNGQYQKVRQ
jgi:hypothetical protein